MATPPETRTTHVWREKNEDDDEIWVDIQRVDKIVSNEEGQGILYRKTTRKMFWDDEADPEAHPTRKTKTLRVEDPGDEDTFVTVRTIEKQITRRGQGLDFKKTTKKFVNDKDINTVREYSVRRVYHWDTEGDPSEDGGLNYNRIDGTKDESQYVDVAVIEKLVQTRGQGLGYKKRTFKFNTAPIKEFSEPSPANVDPSKVVWLDPWQNIVNVQWGGYRLVAFISAQFGSVNYSIKWAGPKKFYTVGELNTLERNGQKVQVPTFGESVSIPTDTQSANGTYPPIAPDGVTITISGNRLAAAEARGAPDYRGFTTLDEREWEDQGTLIGFVAMPNGEHVYYDYNWQPVAADDIPEASERGASLVSKDGVTVYVRLNTGDEATRGVTAYFEGEVLWSSEGIPETVHYDQATELIALTYYDLPDSGNPGVEYYRLTGARASVVDFGDNFTSGDVSRNGKSYVFMESVSEDTTDSIRGFSPSGAPLWTIPGESTSDGWQWGSVTAYGEDYFVVFIFKNIPGIPDSTTAQNNGYRIYDAHTGAMVSEHALSDDIRTAEIYDIDPPAHYGNDINQPSYGANNGMMRSAYWP
jgi:hypothetical protein